MSQFFVPVDCRRKLVVVGDSACGKTCLMIVFIKDQFPVTDVPTIFDNYVGDVEVDGQKVKVDLHDTAGVDVYDRLRQLSYNETDAVVVCFSIDSHVTFQNVQQKWTPEVRHYCRDVPIILVGCKKDLRNDPATCDKLNVKGQNPVSEEEGRAMAERIGAAAYVECSAKTKDGVREVFETVIKGTLGLSALLYLHRTREDGQSEEGGDRCDIASVDEDDAEGSINESSMTRFQMDVVVCEITEQPPSMRESALFSLYKDAEVAIVCYAVDNEETLDHVVDKWIPEVHQFLPKNVPIVLVGCKKDLRNDPATRAALKLKRQKPVSEEEGRAMAERIGAAAYVECSALTKDGVREVFETVINPTVGRAKCRIL
nr:hypothetical protein BaRGS_026201 [Batillaria attramentaria]